MKRVGITGCFLYLILWVVVATAYALAWMFDYDRDAL